MPRLLPSPPAGTATIGQDLRLLDILRLFAPISRPDASRPVVPNPPADLQSVWTG